MTYLVLSLLLCAAVAVDSRPDWDGFRVTFSRDPNNPWAFKNMPQDVMDDASLTFRDDQCNTPNANFLGQRYWYNGDPAITLLYDTNGIIAGIQTSIPKAIFNPPVPLWNTKYIEDGIYWTLTAYFVNPRTICRGGRSKKKLNRQGTGTGLYLQHGPNPVKDSVHIPDNERQVQRTSWTRGGCVPTMGQHYWYNVTREASCDLFVPDCLMYNKGKLTAFCFFANTNLESPRYEHSTPKTAGGSIIPLPDCFFTNPAYQQMSTMHVYLIDDPKTSLC